MALETNEGAENSSILDERGVKMQTGAKSPEELSDLAQLEAEVQEFCEVRDWDQFHTPKDLAIGMVTESAELLDLFRFKSDAECQELFQVDSTRGKIEDEIADIFFFTLRFAQKNGIDLKEALRSKIVKNGKKYPVELSRGSNRKYNEF